MIEFLTSVYFIAPVGLIVVALAIYIIKKCTKILVASRLAEQDTRGIGYIYDILENEFSDKNVLKDAVLIPTSAIKASGEDIKPSSDIVFIGACGVLLITVITDKGEFDNPKSGRWRYRFKNSAGEVEIQPKLNPFDATNPQVRVVAELLDDEGIYSKSIKRLVVYTQTKIRFTNSYPEILHVDELINRIDILNEHPKFTSQEALVAFNAISQYSDFLLEQA